MILRQRRDQFVSHAVGEIFLRRIAGKIGQREYSDGPNLRPWTTRKDAVEFHRHSIPKRLPQEGLWQLRQSPAPTNYGAYLEMLLLGQFLLLPRRQQLF